MDSMQLYLTFYESKAVQLHAKHTQSQLEINECLKGIKRQNHHTVNDLIIIIIVFVYIICTIFWTKFIYINTTTIQMAKIF